MYVISHLLQVNGAASCKRDRSCSPVQSIDFAKSSNVLTQGHTEPLYLNPIKAVKEINGVIIQPPYQPPMPGPSRYYLRNRCSYTGAYHQPVQSLPPPTLPFRPSSSNNLPKRPVLPQHNYYGQPDVSKPPTSISPSNKASEKPSTSSTSSMQASVPQRRPIDYLISTDHLSKMRNIVFLDLDNWPSFFHKLPCCLPDFTFVWGFYGGRNPWYAPMRLGVFREMRQKEQFYLNERCGTTKDAADFAIVLSVCNLLT